MKNLLIVLAFSPLISGATYKETRDVTDSSGKKFSCTYSLFYTTKTVSKSKSSVTCTPNSKGKAVSQDFVIESLGKTVTVKHSIKKGKDAISAVSLEDYVPPTTSGPAPSPVSGEAMDCTCKLPGMDSTVLGRTGFQYQMKGQAGSDRKIMKPTALSRGGGYHGGYNGGYNGGYHGGYGGHGGGASTGGSSSLASIIPGLLSALLPLALVAITAGVAAIGIPALLMQLFPTIVTIVSVMAGAAATGRVDEVAETEDDQARLLAKLNDRQLFGNLGSFNGLGNFGSIGKVPSPTPAPTPARAPTAAPLNALLGLLGGNSDGSAGLASLLGGAGGSTGSNDVVNQIAMQIAQEQIDNFINNGGAEAALTDMVDSGKLEEMINSMMETAMENVDPEEMMAYIQSNLEESMGAGGELEGILGGEHIEEMFAGVKLEDLMGGMNMTELMGGMNMTELMGGMNMTELLNGMDLDTMEMEMQCSCVPAATG